MKYRNSVKLRLLRVLLFIFVVPQFSTQLVRGTPPFFDDSVVKTTVINIPEGSPLQISCPSPLTEVDFEWIKDGELIGETSKDIQYHATSSEHAGVYHCVMRNAFGAVISPAFITNIQYLHDFVDSGDRTVTAVPEIPFVLKRPELISSDGLEVLFSWYHNDAEVNTNATYYVTSRGDLVVKGEAREAGLAGQYRVTASVDGLGEAASGVYFVTYQGLSASEVPSFSIVYGPADSEIKVSDVESELSLDCVPNFNSGVRIKWYLEDSPVTENSPGVRFENQRRRVVMSSGSPLLKSASVRIECRADAASGRVLDVKSAVIKIISSPRLNLLPSELVKRMGETVRVRCSLKAGKPAAELCWWHNGRKLEAVDGILSIPQLGSGDFGIYQCEGSNRAGSVLSTIWLHEGGSSGEAVTPSVGSDGLWGFEDSSVEVRSSTDEEPPVDIVPAAILRPPVDVQESVGQQARFTCAASGTPRPKIYWTFQGERIRVESSKYDLSEESFTISDIKTSDAGVYTCHAGNGGGKAEASATLSVSGVSLIENGPSNQSILIGTNIQIPCEVGKAFAGRAQVIWALNDEPIDGGGNNGLRISRTQNGWLLIRQVGPDNIGEYRCTVRANGLQESQSAWLRIIERPSMPVAVSALLVNDSLPAKIKISWKQGFDGNSPIIRHSIEMRSLGPTGQWGVWETVVESVPPENCCSWIVDNLKPSATAEFRVVASNRYGAGMPSLSTFNVTMPQQPPAAAPKGVAASARSSSSIMVQWQPPAAEQWNGDILGYIVRYRLAGYTLPWIEKNVTNSHVRNVAIEPLITWRFYEIQVAAYNHRGLGVFSKSTEVATLEGVPTQSPGRVRVSVLNSTAVSLSFVAPDQQRIPGVNLGYKAQFWKGIPGKGHLHKQVLVDPLSSDLSLIVDGLEKWGHYNVSVLCYTSPGDGPRSEPVYIVTEEDIPGAVGDLGIDQEQVMSNSAVIQWELPREPNGKIVGFELRYWRSADPNDRQSVSLPGSAVNATLDGLVPSTQYGVEIRAETSKGKGPWTETRFESGVPPELPGRPTALSVSDVQSRSVQLQFVPGFDGHTLIRQWIVEARIGDSSIFHLIYNVSAPRTRSFTISGLRPYTYYKLRLIAENVVGRGAPSEPAAAFETKPTNPETPASRLWAEPVSATAVVLSWTPLQHWQWNGQPKGYLILYRRNGTRQWNEVRTSSLRATDFTLHDLHPYTTYEVDLFSENVFGRSASTGVAQAKTYESVPAGAPNNIKVESDGQRSISVQWSPVEPDVSNGEVLGYKVRIVPEQNELRNEFERTVDVTGEETVKAKIAGLRPYTAYNVFVSAHTIVGSGPENSNPTVVRTGEDLPTEPTNVGFSLVSETEVRLRWVPPEMPNGKIKAYHATYWPVHEDRSTGSTTTQIASNVYTYPAAGLIPNTMYRFAISAENELGMGSEAISDVRTTSVRLPVRNPPVPSRDERKPFSAREISIGWAELVETEEDAPVRFVQLEYQKANDVDWTLHSESIPSAQNRVTIARLRPNTAYHVRIRLRGDFTQSAWSAESEWIKTLDDRPQSPPTYLAAAPFESDGLLLQWTAPDKSQWNSDVLGYKISFRPYPSNESWQSDDVLSRHDPEQRAQTVIRNLKSFRHYIVNMRSSNAEGVSEPSVPVFVYVGYSIPRGNVTGLSAEPQSSTSIVLRWDLWTNSEDVITGFKIRYVPLLSVLSSESREEQLVIVENNTAVISDLLKYTQYQISVSPYNRAGEGGMAVVRETTLQDVPGPVGALLFHDVLLDSVNVSWAPPEQANGRIIRYIVNYNTYKLQDEFLKNIKQPTQMPFIVATGLEEGATYYFSVRAETSAGAGPEVAGNVTVGPSAEGPAAPSRPRPIPGRTSVSLQWTDGTVTAHGVLGHLIQAKRVANAGPTTTASSEVVEKRRTRRAYEAPTHRMGEWVTLSTTIGSATNYEVSYHDLHHSSFYVFRVFARNRRGVGGASDESEQLFVPDSLPEDPFYTQLWFIAIVAMATLLVIVCVVAFLCVTGSSPKYDKRRRSVDSLQLADGNLATFHLKQGQDSRISRSRNDLLTRPGTTTSWVSDRDPPAYGSVLGERAGTVNMYGQLATDVIPTGTDIAAAHRLSVLAGRDVRGSAYAVGVAPPTARSDLISSRGRLEDEHSDGFDSFDDEDAESEGGNDAAPRGDIAGHYDHSDHYSATWRRVRAQEATTSPARVGLPPPPLHRGVASRPESRGTGSDASWPSQQAPALEKGFSSFV